MKYTHTRDSIRIDAEGPMQVAFCMDTLGLGQGLMEVTLEPPEGNMLSSFMRNEEKQAQLNNRSVFILKRHIQKEGVIMVSKTAIDMLERKITALSEECKELYLVKLLSRKVLEARKTGKRKAITRAYGDLLEHLTKHDYVKEKLSCTSL